MQYVKSLQPYLCILQLWIVGCGLWVGGGLVGKAVNWLYVPLSLSLAQKSLARRQMQPKKKEKLHVLHFSCNAINRVKTAPRKKNRVVVLFHVASFSFRV